MMLHGWEGILPSEVGRGSREEPVVLLLVERGEAHLGGDHAVADLHALGPPGRSTRPRGAKVEGEAT